MTEAKKTDFDRMRAVSECQSVCDEIAELVNTMSLSGCSASLISVVITKFRMLESMAYYVNGDCIGHVSVGLEHACSLLAEKSYQVAPDFFSILRMIVIDIREILQEARESGNPATLPVHTKERLASMLDHLTDSAKKGSPSEEVETNHASLVTSPDDCAGKKRLETQTVKTEDISADKPKNIEVETASVRVSISLLDRLMNLAGELVLVRNQFLQLTADAHPSFQLLGESLNAVTMDLQNDVMKTRMQPIGCIFTKIQRICRDLSRDLGKKLEICMEGSDVELDKSILESIRDPLLHIARNCVDHGIEDPDVRVAAGKNETGTLAIKAHHESGQVVIEISDDGKGLGKQDILKKALEMGLVHKDQVSHMSDTEIFNLVFAPGLSTAKEVTDISGRGVGMDVVASNIRRIGGTVEVHSLPGRSTTMKLRIPLTMAIIPAVIVRMGQERYAIPQVKVSELVRIDNVKSHGMGQIESFEGQKVYRLRGDLLALLDLRECLRIEVGTASDTTPDVTNIVVLQDDDVRFGLVVDDIVDSMDIVVKTLPPFLKKLDIYSGVTIMGDGSLVLIVDIRGIAAKNGLTRDTISQSSGETNSAETTGGEFQEDVDYVVVDIGEKGLYSLPLLPIYRLEQFAPSDIETSGKSSVVRYSSIILPLINIRHLIGLDDMSREDATSTDPVPVVVVNYGKQQVGLIVERIFDVVSVSSPIQPLIQGNHGILGTIVIDERVMTVVDVYGLMEKLAGDVRPGDDRDSQQSSSRKKRILLIDDSAFYRRYLGQFLDRNGYEVHLSKDGEEALAVLRQGDDNRFDAIITDIEMPVMDGIAMVREIRKEKRWKNLPIIAVSTHTQNQEVARGISAGVNMYFHKMGGKGLVDELTKILEKRIAA